MRLLCPAKINLHLRVGRRRADGFHPLLTWMVTAGLFDTLTISHSKPNQAGVLQLSSDSPSVPTDATNLVVRAADQLAAAARRAELQPVSAILGKKIPTGAGLGGGSSDAARTLLALNRLWQINWTVEQLSPVAATLGSDVPFFLHGASCICTGRGEFVNPVTSPLAARWVVLVLPEIHMPTPAVYRRFDELGLGFDQQIASQPDWAGWTAMPAKEILVGLVNDLERPAFEICPDLGTLRAGIELEIKRPVRMSGSGSSLFTLYDDANEAQAGAKHISARFKIRAVSVELACEIADDLNAAEALV